MNKAKEMFELMKDGMNIPMTRAWLNEHAVLAVDLVHEAETKGLHTEEQVALLQLSEAYLFVLGALLHYNILEIPDQGETLQ